MENGEFKFFIYRFINKLKKDYPPPSQYEETSVLREVLNEVSLKMLVNKLVIEYSFRKIDQFARERFYVIKGRTIIRTDLPKIQGQSRGIFFSHAWDKNPKKQKEKLEHELKPIRNWLAREARKMKKLMKVLEGVDAIIYVERFLGKTETIFLEGHAPWLQKEKPLYRIQVFQKEESEKG